MSMTWMPPRRFRQPDELYDELRHWLVDGAGRIVCCIVEPKRANPEDSFDARIYVSNVDDTGYFISLDHAKAWCEKRIRAMVAAREQKRPLPTPRAVTEEAEISAS